MSEVEIGAGKRGRRAYAFDDIAVVPSRRTRDPQDVNVQWSIDAFTFEAPILAAPMDSVSSPATVIQMGRLGILGVLDLEGLWTRYEDPTPFYDEIKTLTDGNVTKRMQEIYAEPVKAELITARLAEIRAAGVPVAGSLSPQRTQEFSQTVVDAGVDLFVIRGTTVSAEHVSQNTEPLNLKKFIYELDVPVIVGGASTYTAALHLMRTGAAGVLVGFGGGAASTTRAALGIHAPMATAVADIAGARRDYMDESGGRTCTSSRTAASTPPVTSSRRSRWAPTPSCSARCSPARPRPPRRLPLGSRSAPPELPRGRRVEVGTIAPLENVLNGPTPTWDGRANIVGALRRSMATTGYSDAKEFQRVEVVVAPYHQQDGGTRTAWVTPRRRSQRQRRR